MSRRELAAFVLKMLGVYALIESLPWIQHIGQLVMTFRQGLGPTERTDAIVMSLSVMSPFLASGLIGVVLVCFSRSLAWIIVGGDGDARIVTVVKARHVQAIGFSVVAAMVALQAMPIVLRLTWTLWYLYQDDRGGGGYAGMVKRACELSLSASVQMGLAGVMFFGSRGIAKAWHTGIPDRPAASPLPSPGPAEPEGESTSPGDGQ